MKINDLIKVRLPSGSVLQLETKYGSDILSQGEECGEGDVERLVEEKEGGRQGLLARPDVHTFALFATQQANSEASWRF